MLLGHWSSSMGNLFGEKHRIRQAYIHIGYPAHFTCAIEIFMEGLNRYTGILTVYIFAKRRQMLILSLTM